MNPFGLAGRAAGIVANGIRRGVDAAEGVSAVVRSGIVRPFSPSALVEIGRDIVRSGGPRAHLIYTVNAARDPDRPAILFEERTTTWRELVDRSRRLANHLVERGIGPGDAIAIMLPNRPEFIETQAAALRIGAVTGYINPRLPVDEARALLERTGAKLLVTHRPEVGGGVVDVLAAGEHFDLIVRAAPGGDPDVPPGEDGKVVIFTSGTTGRPKGAVRDMGGGEIASFAGLLRMIPFRHDDVHMVVCPLYHSSGSGFAAMAQGLANPMVLVEHFSPQAFCEHVERHRVTSTVLVPTMLYKLCSWEGAADHDLSSLRIVVCTGAALREDLRERARGLLGDVLYDLYGSTEMGWVSIADPTDQRRKPGTVGRPAHGVDVRVLSSAGDELPTGEIGEIWATSGALMERYLDDPELDRERMRDGYVSVKDVGFLDEDGYLHVVDRADDMIISGGVNVYPAEAEVALSSHPRVSEVAVLGVDDPEWGQRVVAAVVPAGDVSGDDLIGWAKEHASYAAVPKEVRFMDELPRNDVGKVDKAKLAEGW